MLGLSRAAVICRWFPTIPPPRLDDQPASADGNSPGTNGGIVAQNHTDRKRCVSLLVENLFISARADTRDFCARFDGPGAFL